MTNDRRNDDLDAPPPRTSGGADLMEVEKLTWAMLDDDLSETGQRQLEQLLCDSDAARKDYIGCIQLHVDLQDYFAEEKPANTPPSTPPRSPVLGFLNAGNLPLDIGSQTNES